MDDLNEVLDKVGLSEQEVKVYNVIITFGMRTVGQIKSYVDYDYADIRSICDSLVDKNYLKVVRGNAIAESNTLADLFIPLAPKISISSDIANRLSERLNNLSQQVSDLWKNTQGIINEDTVNLINTVDDNFKEYAIKLANLSGTHQEDIGEITQILLEKMKGSSNEAYTKYDETITSPLASLSDKLDALAEQVQQIANTSIEEINASTDKHKKSIESAVDQIKTELNESADALGLLLTGRITALNPTLEDMASQHSQKIDEIVTNVNTNVDDVFSKVEERIGSIDVNYVETAKASFDTHLTTYYGEVDKYQTTFFGVIDKANEIGTESQNLAVKTSEDILDEYYTGEKDKVAKLQDGFLKAVQTVQENAVTQLGGVLGNTSKSLSDLEKTISSNLTNNQKILDKELGELTSSLGTSLDERFTEVKTSLTGFVNDLKSTSQNNVKETIDAANGLKDFIENFLSEVNTNLDGELDKLSSDVSSNLGEIIANSNADIDKSVEENKERLSGINSGINDNLSEFQNNINTFLTTVKSDLQTRLENAQNTFKEGVDGGVDAYNTESEKLHQVQAEQMNEIKEEAQALSTSNAKARENINSFINSTLDSLNKQSIDTVNSDVISSVDKFARQFTNFSDKTVRDFERFYEDFHDSSSGLREEVPNELEATFTDQYDRITTFKTDFERVARFVDDALFKMEDVFNPDSKTNFKKVREEMYNEITRTKSDFNQFNNNITTHFNDTIDSLELIQTDVLNRFNKTIQDELTDLEGLMEKKGKEVKQMTGEFTKSIDGHRDNFLEEIKTGLSETTTQIKSKISTDLLSLFQQPLESIISKAQSVATGTEGLDSENRVIKTQKVLIDKIQEAVDVLVDSLQTAFNDSIEELDNKVEDSINTSNTIISDVKEGVGNAFETQEKSTTDFTESLRSSLSDVQKSLIDNLSNTINSTKSNVSGTVDEKSKEVAETVSKRNTELTEITDKKLVEVDNSLSEFKGTLDEILSNTTSDIDNTVKTSSTTQNENMTTNLTSLAETTKAGLGSLTDTQNSLKDNVGKPLAKIETDVKKLVTDFDKQTAKVKTDLSKKVKGYYDKLTAQLKETTKLKATLEKATKSTKDNLGKVDTTLNKELLAHHNEFKEARVADKTTFREQFDASVNGFKEETNQFVEDIFLNVTEQLSFLQSETLAEVDNTKGNIDITVTNSIETVRTDILNPAQEIANVIMMEKDNISTETKSIAEKYKSITGDQEAIMKGAKDEFEASLAKSFENNEGTWKERSAKVYDELSGKLPEISDEFKGKIGQETESGKHKVTDALNSIPSTIEETLDAAAKSMLLLNEISKGSIALDPKYPEGSYFDVSREAIIANLNGVISRTKSSAVIVAPSLDWFDVELLHKLTRANIRIIIDPNEITNDDKAVLDKIKESNVQSSFRKLDKNRYRSEFNMIMITRDKEEIVFASLPNAKDPYGFVSQDELFIDKFTELISPFQAMPPLDM